MTRPGGPANMAEDGDDFVDSGCARCGGSGVIVSCIDDTCRGAGECFHGDGEAACPDCDAAP